MFVRNSHKEKIPATGLADTRSMSFNFSKLKAPSQKLNTLYLTHSPPQPRSRRISIHSFVPLGSLNFPAIFCDGGGYVETRFLRSHARKRKKPLRQELLSMDTSLSSTTNKTLKLYAENQPKALLISKETL